MDIHKVKYSIEISKEGLPTLAIHDNSNKKVFLHSRYDPLKEAEAMNDEFDPDKFDTIIVLGIGLGYHLQPVREIISKFRKIYLIDLLSNIEHEIDQIPLTSFLCHQSNIKFITGKSIESIENILNELLNLNEIKGLKVIEHYQSIRLFSHYYVTVKKIIERILSRKAGDKATKRAFGLLFLNNILKNLKLLQNCFPVSSFFYSFDRYPCIIISPGPSIEPYLNAINKFQHNFFIIAVDSSMPVLHYWKIEPDFCLSIDPQPYILEHFFNSNECRSTPVFSISSNHQIFMKYNCFLSLNSHPISQLINQLYPDRIGSIDSSTGTVSGDAINMARLFGFKAAGLFGFDFSFSNYNIYCRGTSYQKRFAEYFQNRFTTVETSNFNYIMKSSRGFRYNNRFTRRSFINYKESIENMIKSYKIDNLSNINEIGIPLQNVPNVSIDEFLSKYGNQKIQKKTVIKEILAESCKLKNIISISSIKEILSEKNNFNEVITASLEKEVNKNKIRKIKDLIASIDK